MSVMQATQNPTNQANTDATVVNLLGMDLAGLKTWLASIGEKPFRATQIIKWIHQQGVTDFNEMTNLSAQLRDYLKQHAVATTPTVVTTQKSEDGTRKWLMAVPGGNLIETVFIPEGARGTLCVSSQVGCALNCSFCATARQGFNRNLTSAEIIGQVFLAQHKLLQDAPDLPQVTNVVMMGMGEPLLNFENLIPALNLMREDNAYGLAKRRVTVSTSGIVPAIDRLAAEADVALAISLHAPFDNLRNLLVPINRKYGIDELLAVCRRYLDKHPKMKITMEYILIAGVNDQEEHAQALTKILLDVPCKINLIPYNPVQGVDYKTPSRNSSYHFRDILVKAGFVTTIRTTRGDDIKAACGQLVGDVQDRTSRSRLLARAANQGNHSQNHAKEASCE